MKWENLRESENVQDRRRMSGPVMAGGGGIGLLVLVVIVWALGGDPTALLENPGGNNPAALQNGPADPKEEHYVAFVKRVLGSTEDVWSRLFREEYNQAYDPPELVLFSRSVDTGCGAA